MTIDLKSIVSKQIPEFAREDYPLFVAFIEAYYEYLDQTEQRNITELRDIDKTLDSFIQYFKNELDIFGGTYNNINERLFLRKIKEVLLAKGGEASYKFLFKLLYGKTASISYPWDQVLKASDGKWQQDMSIFVNVTDGDPNTLPGNRITILGVNQRIKVFVNKVVYRENNVWEVFIDRYYYGKIEVGYSIEFGSVAGTILPTTVSYSVELPGTGFKVGQIITGTTVSQGKFITQRLKVTKINPDPTNPLVGGLVNFVTLDFGYGYDSDFFLFQASGTVVGNSNISIGRREGATGAFTQQYSITNDTKIDSYADYGYILTPDYVVLEYTDPTYAATYLQQFYQQSINEQGSHPNYVLIKFNIGAVAKYQGHYNTNDGFLDDDMYIQDSYRYQKYSYLITVDEKLDNFKSLIKSYLHPAGTALFAEYQIQNEFNPATYAIQELEQWISKATFTTINKTITNDNVILTDSGGRSAIDPYAGQDYVIPDQQFNPPVSAPFTG
jgi:hypothetical protein